MRATLLAAVLLLGLPSAAFRAAAHDVFKLLVFSKTAGFRHDSIPQGIAAIQALGAAHEFAVSTSENAADFNDANLAQFKAVVFLCTTGDILNSAQQAAFERYIRAGGGYVGVHSSSDTEYDWPWYGELVGAYFRSHPAIQQATVRVNDPAHPSTRPLPRKWVRTDEWYSFRRNPRGDVHVLATLDEATYAPSDAMSGTAPHYDHPIAWCHEFDGGRAWYTGGGHTQQSYSEPLFREHLLGGIRWAARVEAGDAGATIETNFQKVVLDATPSNPMELAVAPDGRVLFVERGGRLKIWKPNTRQTVVAGQLAVDTGREDGLLGLALDPGFAANGWIYLFYSPAGTAPEQHVSRFQLNGDTLDLSSEKLLLTIPVQRNDCCHSGGSLTFGPDGSLFIATGDNTNPFESAGFAPLDERPGRSVFDAQKSSSNPNDLRGKILRIRPQANGTAVIPAGNLFPPGTPGTRPEIYVMGSRNPFRIAVDQATGWLYWGEVGPDAGANNVARGPAGYDEWNQSRGPGNYGWPYFGGDNQPYRDFDFATSASGSPFNATSPTNNSPNNSGAQVLPPARPAWIWYPYGDSPLFPEVNGAGGRTAMGGPVYHFNPALASARKLPAYYDKTVFIYEWSRNFIKEVKLDDNGNLLKINPFLSGFAFARPMDMEIGPDGAIYLIEWGTGFGGNNADAKVIRIDYTGGNRAPLAVATASPDAGGTPLEVKFGSAGTADPEGDPLSYAWSFLGDGTVNSTDPSPTYTYATPGNYTAQLTVSDGQGNSAVANVAVVVGNHRPSVEIAWPLDGGVFDWHESLRYRGGVADAEDGATPGGIACASLQWELSTGHNDHAHGVAQQAGCEGLFEAPAGHGDDGDNVFLVVKASYTDKGSGVASALVGQQVLVLQPRVKQAEHFTRTNGVGTVPTTDVNGGSDVGSIDDGDWIALAPFNATFLDGAVLRFRGIAGGRAEFRAGGADGLLLGTVELPADTGGHVDVPAPLADPRDVFPLPTTELFIVFKGRTAGAKNLGLLNWLRFSGPGMSAKQAPFGGTPRAIPGTIEAEDFDEGGEGIAWHDHTPANTGGDHYRGEGVDVAAVPAAGNGRVVSAMAGGEWLEYTVNVTTPGLYDLSVRAAAEGAGGEFRVAADGVDKAGGLVFPTAGPDGLGTVGKAGIALKGGIQVLRVTAVGSGLGVGRMDSLAFTLVQSNAPPTVTLNAPVRGSEFSAPASIPLKAGVFDPDGKVASVQFLDGDVVVGTDNTAPFGVTWDNVPVGNHVLSARATDDLGAVTVSAPVTVRVVAGQAPFGAVRRSIPGTLQAEDFDEGGDGVGFNDSDGSNNGGQYRSTAVDIESTTDSGGGFDVGWTWGGEWLEYSVNATTDGTYRLEARVASSGVAGQFHVELDGSDITGPRSPGNTGGWQTWKTLSVPGIPINAGPHVVRLAFDSAGPNGTVGNHNWLRFVLTAINPPVLQSANSLGGVFADDPGATSNPALKQITVPLPAGMRFFRLRGGSGPRIKSIEADATSLTLVYE